MAALPRPRLHANLLFYGLDGGTWSDPPEGNSGSDWAKMPWEATYTGQEQSPERAIGYTVPPGYSAGSVEEMLKEAWGNGGGSNAATAGATEQSTDEGSDEPKGSESDSLPDSSEGWWWRQMARDQLSHYGVFHQNLGADEFGNNFGAVTMQASGVPSIGSYHHLSGQCSRCCFHPKGRCANGYSCQFCHYDHDKRPRNGKKKRYRRQGDGSLEGIE